MQHPWCPDPACMCPAAAASAHSLQGLGGRVDFARCWRVIVDPGDGRPASGLAVSRWVELAAKLGALPPCQPPASQQRPCCQTCQTPHALACSHHPLNQSVAHPPLCHFRCPVDLPIPPVPCLCSSVGDPDFKEPLHLVTATPDVIRERLVPGDDFVILASDGLVSRQQQGARSLSLGLAGMCRGTMEQWKTDSGGGC